MKSNKQKKKKRERHTDDVLIGVGLSVRDSAAEDDTVKKIFFRILYFYY